MERTLPESLCRSLWCGRFCLVTVLFEALALGGVSVAVAGVTPASQTVGANVVYLGTVPAAVTRQHPITHVERTMHGGSPRDIHEIHVLAAVFDKSTGARIKNAKVIARFIGEHGRKWSVTLQPMTVNGALTYGGYTNVRADMSASIIIDVVRPIAGKPIATSARFEYEHD